MGYREKFLEQGIPYDDIDEELIEIIDILNFTLGLETQYCCFGHTLNEGLVIGFKESVTDEQIMKLVSYLQDKIHVSFKKWVRNSNRLLINWYLEDLGERFDNLQKFEAHKKTYIDVLIDHFISYSIVHSP